MRIHLAAVLVFGLAVLGMQADAWGQGTRGMTGGGTTGGGTTGGGTRTGSTGGSSSGASLSDIGSVGTRTDSESVRDSAGSFVGASADEMEGFVGAVQSGESTSTGGRTQTTGRNTGSTNRNTGSGRTQNRNTTRNTGSNRQSGSSSGVVSSALRVAFAHVAPAAEELSDSVAERLTNARRIKALSELQVVVDGRTATLRGQVATPYDRALAERVALLEAGIARVVNEIEVAAVLEETE